MNNLPSISIISVLFLSACAPITPKQTVANTQNVVTMKQVPKITANEKNILKANGFAIGVWSDNCSDKNSFSAKYIDQGEKYIADYSENGKLVRKAEFYDVKQISPGVITFKMQNFSQINNFQYISNNKTGYVNGKRMVFDLTVLPLNGPTAGIEMVSIKDGFSVKVNNDGTLEKVKPASPTFKCN
jgi:hypothetical protein